MGKMLQIRNVSPELHGELRRRARKAGRTLTAYVQQILEREVARPAREEIFARVHSRRPATLKKPASDYISEARREAC